MSIVLLRRDSAIGTVPLKRYYNSTTGHNYYSTAADQPSGFTEQATLGYLDSSSGTGLNALYRHFNSTVGDYLLSTSSTPPSGYVLQATLGYLQVGSNVTTYIRNPIGQVVQAKTADVTYNYTYDSAIVYRASTTAAATRRSAMRSPLPDVEWPCRTATATGPITSTTPSVGSPVSGRLIIRRAVLQDGSW